MWFFKNNKFNELEEEVADIRRMVATLKFKLDILDKSYLNHLDKNHNAYKKVMEQARAIKDKAYEKIIAEGQALRKEKKHRGRPRRDRKNDSR